MLINYVSITSDNYPESKEQVCYREQSKPSSQNLNVDRVLRVMQKSKSRKAHSRSYWRLEQVCVPFLLISMLFAWVECCPDVNERDVSMSLITQHPYQPGKPCQDAGGDTGILYCQWCQRSEEVIWLPLLWTTGRISVWLFWILNIFPGSLLERFSTAKLVMMTSQTPSASRSVAANDVSSCAYILPHWHPFLPSTHSPI